ncbi:NUDIX hydrolase [Actinosynnema sp. NPDC004786]
MASRATRTAPVEATAPPMVGLSVRLAVLAVRAAGLRVLLHTGEQGPELPGAPLDPATSLDDARDAVFARHLGLVPGAYTEQLGTFGPHHGRAQVPVATVAYLALVHVPDEVGPAGSTCWAPMDAVPTGVAAAVVEAAMRRARTRLEHTPAGTALCPPAFTVAQLRRAYEQVWGCDVDPRNFHRKVTGGEDFLVATGDQGRDRGRPAMLYRRGSAERLHPLLRRE